MKNIYKHIVSQARLNPNFKLLTACDLFEPAKNLIESITQSMDDKDGNFIKDFQSTGFEARLWEVHLFNMLTECGFNIRNTHASPDFHAEKSGIEVFIEASSSSEKDTEPFLKEFISDSLKKGDISIQNQLLDYYVMRMGSVLFSKLNKKYWDLEWVKNKPLIIALKPSHNYMAKFIPDSKIIEYLYGIKSLFKSNDEGLQHLQNIDIPTHEFNGKLIPSNFFSQDLSEHISAVIFTNNCDLHKFNRLGFQSNFSNKDLFITRSGLKYDSVPGAKAKQFSYSVNPGIDSENWSESVSIFHNPNAAVKIDPSVFSCLRQVWMNDDKTFGGTINNGFVFHSLTAVFLK